VQLHHQFLKPFLPIELPKGIGIVSKLADQIRAASAYLNINKYEIPFEPFMLQSTPRRELFSVTWRDLTEVNVSIGLRPEFSARANGTASKADANERMAYCSIDDISSAALLTAREQVISAAPPP
jgi:hypothetical protein